jgi:hypothetical protein
LKILQRTGCETGEWYSLVGKGDNVRKIADEVSRIFGSLDWGFHLTADDLSLASQSFGQILK